MTNSWIGMKNKPQFLRNSKLKPTDVYFVPRIDKILIKNPGQSQFHRNAPREESSFMTPEGMFLLQTPDLPLNLPQFNSWAESKAKKLILKNILLVQTNPFWSIIYTISKY